MEDDDHGLLSLTWNNHSAALLHSLSRLRSQDVFCDATIVCEDKHIPVHKVVLSSCSEYFEEIFSKTPCKHPFIILKGVMPIDLEALLDYMYKGRVNIFQNRLPHLMKASDLLKVRGLSVSDDISEELSSPSKIKSSSSVVLNSYVSLKSSLKQKSNSECQTDISMNSAQESFTGNIPKIKKEVNDGSSPKRLSGPLCMKGKKSKMVSKGTKSSPNSDSKKIREGVSGSDSSLHLLGESVVVLERNLLNLSEDQLYIIKDNQNGEQIEVKPEEEFLFDPNEQTKKVKRNISESKPCYSSSSDTSYESVDYDALDLDASGDEGEGREQGNQKQFDVNNAKENEEPAETKTRRARLRAKKSKKKKKKKTPSLLLPKWGEEEQDPNQTVDTDRPLKCKQCDYRTRFSSSLIAHARTHLGFKPYKCKLCNHSANTRMSLVRHLTTHSGERPFKCTTCLLRFKEKAYLAKHNKYTCKGRGGKDRPIKCSLCPFQTEDQSAIALHMKTHVVEKQFVCAFCPHETTTNSLLRHHVTTSHKHDLKDN